MLFKANCLPLSFRPRLCVSAVKITRIFKLSVLYLLFDVIDSAPRQNCRCRFSSNLMPQALASLDSYCSFGGNPEIFTKSLVYLLSCAIIAAD